MRGKLKLDETSVAKIIEIACLIMKNVSLVSSEACAFLLTHALATIINTI